MANIFKFSRDDEDDDDDGGDDDDDDDDDVDDDDDDKQRLQTLSIDNACFNKNFLYYLTFVMLQHTSSEVNGYNCYKHLKNTKIKSKKRNKSSSLLQLALFVLKGPSTPIKDSKSRIFVFKFPGRRHLE